MEKVVPVETPPSKYGEDLYRKLVECAGDAFFLVDAETGAILEANPRAAELTGRPLPELVGMHQTGLHPPELAEIAARRFREHLADLRRPMEGWLRHRDGRNIPVEVTSRGFDLEGRRVVLGIFRDITERRLAEESSRRYDRLLSSMPDCASLLDRDLVYRVVNRSYRDALGIPLERILGRSAREVLGGLLPEAFEHLILPHLHRALAGEVVRYRAWIDFPGWGRRYSAVTYSPYTDDEGIVAGVLANVRDLSGLVEAEEALRESQAQLEGIFNLAAVSIAVGDPAGTWIRANPAFQRLVGYTEEELKARTVADITHPDDLRVTRERIADIIEGRVDSYRSEKRYLRKDGALVWVDLSVSGIRDRAGRITALIGAGSDITERKLAEEERRASEERFRAVWEGSPVGIGVIRVQDFRFLQANPALCRMMGCDEEALRGMTVRDITPGLDYALDERARSESQAVGETAPFEKTIRRRDGREIRVRITTSLLRDGRGGPEAAIVVIEDITERNRNEELIQVQRDLGLAFAAGPSLADGVDRCLDAALRVSGLECGGIYLVDGAGGDLVLAARRVLSPEFAANAFRHPVGSTGWWTAIGGRSIFLGREEIACQEGSALRSEGLSALAMIPLRHESRILGCLSLASRTIDEVSVEVRPAIEAIATQIGNVIAGLQAKEARRESEDRYRTLFEQSPVAIWEGDLSAVKAEVDRLRASGIGDLDGHLGDRPEDVLHLAGLIRIIDVNETSGRSFGAIDKAGFIPRFLEFFSRSEVLRVVRRMLVSLASGARTFEDEIEVRRPSGETVSFAFHAVVVSGQETTWRRVLASFVDITAHKRAQEALGSSREGLRKLAGRLQSIREEEQTRISREIHDELGQLLTGLKMDLRGIENRLCEMEGSTAANAVLDRAVAASELVDRTIAAVQRIAAELRPSVLDRLGLCPALQQEARLFRERTGIECDVALPGREPPLTPEVSTALFRIFQEALTNAARHAGASRVDVVFRSDVCHVVMRVRDDGKGIDPAEAADGGSLGLLGMRERAALLGGELTISRGAKSGTVVMVRIPCAQAPGSGREP